MQKREYSEVRKEGKSSVTWHFKKFASTQRKMKTEKTRNNTKGSGNIMKEICRDKGGKLSRSRAEKCTEMGGTRGQDRQHADKEIGKTRFQP